MRAPPPAMLQQQEQEQAAENRVEAIGAAKWSSPSLASVMRSALAMFGDFRTWSTGMEAVSGVEE